MAFLLTWHGTLLCRHRQGGELVHRPLSSALDEFEPVTIDLPLELLQYRFDHYLRARPPELPAHPPGMLQRFLLQRSRDQLTLNIQANGVFLCAERDTGRVTLSATEARDWEAFLPVSPAELDALRLIQSSSWLIRSSGMLVERPSTSQHFSLPIGDLAADVRYQVPFDLSLWPHRLTLFRDGWRVDQICLYRPLVYYTAFSSPVIMQQFALSIRSLIEFGRYQGQIALLTDKTVAELAELLPPEHLARLVVITFSPADRIDFMAARYLILDWLDGWAFQPLLYVDSDIVFDLDVAPMLRAIATADRISAPIESPSTLTHTPSVGATLLQRDFCTPGFMAGFNSGTLGIPNLRAHAETIRLIRQVIVNHAGLFGREALPWADQEIANYVSFRLAHFDTGLISPFVRYAGADAQPQHRRGLVHFWPAGDAAARVQAMRGYMEQLRAMQQD